MNKKQKIIITFLLLLFLCTIIVKLYKHKIHNQQVGKDTNAATVVSVHSIYNTKLQVGKQHISVEVADTPSKQTKGLSGKKELKDGTGMIFPYSPPRRVSFWMPDMNFPIDIIYIKDNTIFQIYHNVPNHPSDFPKEKLPSYPSSGPVDLVLEVPAMWCQNNQIQEGSQVHILTDNN